MAKKTVADISVQNKKVLMRCDFNVPLDDNGNITSDARITKALPAIKHVLDNGGSLILMSHLGRPKGKVDDKFSLAPVARRLSELLGKEVVFADDCIGTDVQIKAAALMPGDVMLLEDTDPDGDIAWLIHVWWYGKGPGSYQFIGGTGKWEGIQGRGVTRGMFLGRSDDHFMLKSELYWNLPQ